MQEWWTGSRGGDRGRDDRVRDGDRQGRRPLRLPLQPAQEPRVVLAGDRARRPRRRAESICELLACPDDVPTLENFAFGDTPTREALDGLLAEVLDHPVGAEFAVSEYELSARHDVRPLVLKTVLTYLELDGVLRQGTPFYAGYRLRPLGEASLDEIVGGFDESRAGFLRRLIATGKTGRTWTTLAPDDAAAAARRGAQPDRRGARVPRPAGPRRAAAGRGAPALHAPRPPGLRAPTLVERPARALRAPGAGRDRADRERARARHPRRLPGRAPSSATSARRGPSRAGTAATASPDAPNDCPSPSRNRRSRRRSAPTRSQRSARAIPTRSAPRDSRRASSPGSRARRQPARD